VVDCIARARSGDTIVVTAGNGSAVWTPRVVVEGKALDLAGPGSGSLTIAGAFVLRDSASRVHGFTFDLSTAYIEIERGIGWRLDHNTLRRATWDLGVLIYGLPAGPSEGLMDHNVITYSRIVNYGESYDTGGSRRWSEPLALGSEHAVYVEDNTFDDPSAAPAHGNAIDANIGGRYVFRFNKVRNTRVEAHSLQGDRQRGAMKWEVYRNTMTTDVGPALRPFFMRGGTGLMFDNLLTGGWTRRSIDVDNVRTCEPRGSWGQCDGRSIVDGRQKSGGYPCRDQIGTSTDAGFWDFANPGTPPAQASVPAYLWNNTMNGAEMPVRLNLWRACGPIEMFNLYRQISADRDYYVLARSFRGTSGIGRGAIAARPRTCTPGVAYWATDEGDWNQRQPGPDGQLYRCTARDTWSLYYVPYTYPHPLQAKGTS
jgi:hypothetical protein